MRDIICHIDMSKVNGTIKEEVTKVWGKFLSYHIFNVSDENYQEQYAELARTLGTIRVCHPVNDKNTTFSESRDIKYNPDIYHYFASNERQPLHTDYAYYREDECPDWLMLFCIYPSEFGGKTNLITTRTLTKILEKYNPDLLERLKIDVNWFYTGKDGDKVHYKQLFDGETINWNYWQIKEKLNNKKVMEVREEFFRFLEDVIVDGSIYDFSKVWKPGDCIIFNDKECLHGRDAFLGDRWLKDHAFFEKEKNKEMKK